ncbi:ribonuclease H-like domain-containing protein [Suillus plorans]|uniref:Ribonuclease H-like domain-containing protein n=1 Tax=Suillus plorans TaxID=116603 RepID=A0A9P7ANK7_9AGAM|nr:ribonuclease H-like domain-containing protein [Suillus plorans]KAG1792926.1 ribonuclease H-like domain-containing protein [Suillus plorans]
MSHETTYTNTDWDHSADGALLDAGDITWFHDADDDTLLPTSRMPLPPPAIMIAGSRRSARVPRPASKLIDPNNAVLGKRKATGQRVVLTEDESEDAVAEDPEWDDADEVLTDAGTATDMDTCTDDDTPSTYQQTKEMGDADREGAKRRKSDLTADIRTIFTRESNTINFDTGKEEDGHWCEVCKANGLAWKFSFLKGSVTSLRAHIWRHKDHTKLYKDRCCKRGIQPHMRALPADDVPSNQKTLDSAVIGWFTADNATNNDSAINGHFSQAIGPTSSSKLGAGNDNDNDDDDDNSDTSDALGKALALIVQIRKSPQARAFFRQSCAEVNVPVLELLQWVRTRWASLFTCLTRLLLLQKGVNRFVRLADDSDDVPNLRKKQYADFKLSQSDWVQLSLLREVLQEPANATQSFSSAKNPTVWRAIPVLEFLQQSWQNMADDEKFSSIADALQAGLENLGKWSRKTDETDMYFICLALDPNYKLEYARAQWDADAFDEGKKKLEAAFDYYHAPVTPQPSPSEPIPSASSQPPTQYGHSWMRSAILAHQSSEKSIADPRHELALYLTSPLEEVADVVRWWGSLSHASSRRRSASERQTERELNVPNAFDYVRSSVQQNCRTERNVQFSIHQFSW